MHRSSLYQGFNVLKNFLLKKIIFNPGQIRRSLEIFSSWLFYFINMNRSVRFYRIEFERQSTITVPCFKDKNNNLKIYHKRLNNRPPYFTCMCSVYAWNTCMKKGHSIIQAFTVWRKANFVDLEECLELIYVSLLISGTIQYWNSTNTLVTRSLW